MHKYVFALRPVVEAGGIDTLPSENQQAFKGVIMIMTTLINNTKEVKSASINEDYSVTVVANEDIYDVLVKMSDKAIVTKVS